MDVALGKLILYQHTVCRSFFLKVYFALEQKSAGIVPLESLNVPPKFSLKLFSNGSAFASREKWLGAVCGSHQKGSNALVLLSFNCPVIWFPIFKLICIYLWQGHHQGSD